jgi:hypothetical protein
MEKMTMPTRKMASKHLITGKMKAKRLEFANQFQYWWVD